MCGLVGFITKNQITLTRGQLQKRKQALEALLLANEERGKDSTGIATIKQGKPFLLKQVISASQFIQTNQTRRLMGNSCKILIGHTRHATQGANTVANAHPFHIGTILGAHNGTISNYQDLGPQKVEVDSQAIFSQLNSQHNNYIKALGQVVGTCTLSWVDLNQPSTVYLVSHQNPLAMGRVSGINTIFWSSLKSHLGVVLQAVFGSTYEVWDLKPDYVYTILSKLQIQKQAVNFGESVRKIERTTPLLAPVKCYNKKYFHGHLSHLGNIDDEYREKRTLRQCLLPFKGKMVA